MKVMLIGTLPPIKGISPYCQGLLEALSKRIDVEFIGFKKIYPDFLYPGGTRIRDKEYMLIKIKNTKVRNVLTYYNPLSWIWAGLTAKGEIIHAQWWSNVLAPVYFTLLFIYKFLKRKRILITVHNVIPHETTNLDRILNRLVLSFGDRFITHTEGDRKSLSEIYDIPKEKIDVVPHGILIPAPIMGISKKDAKKHLGIAMNSRVVLYFGNIRAYKGLDILIRAMKHVIEREPRAILLIAGELWEDWQKYEDAIAESGIGGNVMKVLNFIPPSEVEYYFSSADVVVLPYKHFDSQSGVGAMALAFGKPLVVTRVGGLPDFVKDELAIARPNDAGDLAKVIARILRDDRLSDKLSSESRQLAKRYKWGDAAEKTVQIYEKLSR